MENSAVHRSAARLPSDKSVAASPTHLSPSTPAISSESSSSPAADGDGGAGRPLSVTVRNEILMQREYVHVWQ